LKKLEKLIFSPRKLPNDQEACLVQSRKVEGKGKKIEESVVPIFGGLNDMKAPSSRLIIDMASRQTCTEGGGRNV